MLPPATRHHRRRSGRDSTYRTVQIRRATSCSRDSASEFPAETLKIRMSVCWLRWDIGGLQSDHFGDRHSTSAQLMSKLQTIGQEMVNQRFSLLPFLAANVQNVHAMILRLRVRASQREQCSTGQQLRCEAFRIGQLQLITISSLATALGIGLWQRHRRNSPAISRLCAICGKSSQQFAGPLLRPLWNSPVKRQDRFESTLNGPLPRSSDRTRWARVCHLV